MELQALEKLNPHDDELSRKQFLDHFRYSDTTLTPFERQKAEAMLIEFHDFLQGTGLTTGQIESSKSNSH